MTIDYDAVRAADVPLARSSVDDRWWERSRPSSVTVAALLSWVAAAALGAAIVHGVDANPLLTQGVALPLSVGVLGALVLAALAWWLGRIWLIGVAAGAYAGWATTTVLAALNGTPFGYGGVTADAGRMSALATHFATTWHNTDAADPSQPAEYPPLYPMVIGRIAALTGKPAWTLLKPAQALLVGVIVIAGFVLWQRLVHPAVALVVAVSFVAVLPTPSKGNEALALAVFLPWLLLTFCPPPGRRPLHPIAAGVTGGLMVPWFPSLLMVGFLGITAMAVWGWRVSLERSRYLIRAAAVVVTAFVIASWYIVPLVAAYASGKTEVVADGYRAAGLVSDPLQLFASDGTLLNLVRIVGVIGGVLLLRRAWWAPPLALLLLGTQVLRALVLLRFASTGHAFLLFYAPYVTGMVTLVAGLLVMARLVVWLARRAVAYGPPGISVRPTIAVVVAMAVTLFGYATWAAWAPSPRGQLDQANADVLASANLASVAHAESLPNGTLVRFPTTTPRTPIDVETIVRDLQQVRGPYLRPPQVLSYDERIFSFEPWRNWLPPGRTSASALIQWDSRSAELLRLAQIRDPAQFAAATAHTTWGSIDVIYALRKHRKYHVLGATIRPSQLSQTDYVVFHLPNNAVLVIRRP